jgi:hypothetical protein
MSGGPLSVVADDNNEIVLVKDGVEIARIRRNAKRNKKSYIVIKADQDVRIIRRNPKEST